jgi:hypothetical protein
MPPAAASRRSPRSRQRSRTAAAPSPREGAVGQHEPVSVFRYYGNAIEGGIDPLAFLGVTAAAVALAALGAWLFERRDLAA